MYTTEFDSPNAHPFQGRIPKAIQVAKEQNAELVIFGTGASQADGIKEGEFTLNYGLDHWDALPQFAAFTHLSVAELAALKEWFVARAVTELESRNTVQVRICLFFASVVSNPMTSSLSFQSGGDQCLDHLQGTRLH